MRYFNRKTTLIIFFLMLQVAGALPAQEINISGEVSEQFRASEAERQRDTIYISLSNALEELVANNELLKKAEARTKAASFAYEQAKGEMLPKVDADFTYDYLDIVPGFRSELLGNIQHDMFPKIKVSQQIYAGGKLKYAKEAASAKTASMQQAFLAEKIDLKLSLCINYFRLQSLLSQKQIIRANLARLQKQQQYTRLMVNAGRMSQLEIGRIDVAMEEAEGDLLRIDNEYQTTSNRIGLLMGRQSGRLFLPEDSLQLIPYDVDEKAMFATALDNNPLWKQTQLDLHRAEQEVNIKEAARLPRISASAYYGYEFGFTSFSLNDNKRYYIGLNASIPIYHGKVISEKINEAEAEVEQISWQREYFKKNLASRLQEKYSTLKEKEQQIVIRKKTFEQARESYRMALLEYHAGRRSNTDLLDILNVLLENRLMLDQAILDYNSAGAWLKAVMGIL